jgi:hypothetical protein
MFLSFNNFLQENVIQGKDQDSNVYVNPTSKDIAEIIKNLKIGNNPILLRFLAHKESKAVYFWYSPMTHDEMMSVIKKKFNIYNIDEVYTDTCRLIGNSITFEKTTIDTSMYKGVFNLLKRKEYGAKGLSIPLPYKTLKDFVNNISSIMDSYQFVSNYIDNFSTMSSLAMIKLNSKKK